MLFKLLLLFKEQLFKNVVCNEFATVSFFILINYFSNEHFSHSVWFCRNFSLVLRIYRKFVLPISFRIKFRTEFVKPKTNAKCNTATWHETFKHSKICCFEWFFRFKQRRWTCGWFFPNICCESDSIEIENGMYISRSWMFTDSKINLPDDLSHG